MIIVPMDTPGLHRRSRSTLMGEHDINATFYDDVRVPAKTCVGEENGGWDLITNQLNHERVTLCSRGIVERQLDDVRRWAQRHEARRRPPGHRPGVGAAQPGPGARPARVPAAHQLEGRVGARAAATLDPADASTIKVFGTEFYLEAYRLLMEVLGPARRTSRATRPAPSLRGRLERHAAACIILTFGGGTNEMQRDLIAMFGLGFPLAPR